MDVFNINFRTSFPRRVPIVLRRLHVHLRLGIGDVHLNESPILIDTLTFQGGERRGRR